MNGDKYSVLPLLLLKKFGISGGRGLNQWLGGEPGVGDHPGRTCLWMEFFKESGLEVVQNKGLLCKNNTWWKTPKLHCHNVDSIYTNQESTRDSHWYYILWIRIKKYTVHTYTVYSIYTASEYILQCIIYCHTVLQGTRGHSGAAGCLERWLHPVTSQLPNHYLLFHHHHH